MALAPVTGSALPGEAELLSFARAAAQLLIDRQARAPGSRTIARRAGVGIQHFDHRDYAPGDEVRHIDWRRTARFQRPIVRRFESESVAEWSVLVDASSSMAAHGGAKARAAVQMAAAMSYALLHLGHRVGAMTFGSRVRSECGRGRGQHHYAAIARMLDATHPALTGERSDLGACLRHVHGAASVFVVGDFLADDEMCRDLAALRQRSAALHVVQVRDDSETALTEAGEVDLVDVETGVRLQARLGDSANGARDARALGHDRTTARLLRAQRRRLHRLGREPAVAADLACPPGPGASALLSFLSPLWLLGLALLPLVRWLHRGGPHRRDVPVSRLALWRGAEVTRAEPGGKRPPDPAWRRRALLTALLLLVLAGPQWPERLVRVTLWIDDSLAMLTREDDGPRLAVGLARVRALLASWPEAEVETRSLSDPWTRRGALDDATVAALVAAAGRREPAPPPAALLQSGRQQWLLTDGADATLLKWPGGRAPDRVVRVGSVARNVGLERLSARRAPGSGDRLDVLLKVTNGGTSAEDRTVLVASGATEHARRAIRLEPGASQLVEVSIPASSEVHASLQPGDALAQDDTIALDLAPLRRRRIALDPACPAALASAASAHPALEVVPLAVADADAVVACGSSLATPRVPTLRIVAERTPSRLTGAIEWSADVLGSRRLALDAERLQVAARLQAHPGDSVLLAVGDEPVVVVRGGDARSIDTSLDFAAMASTRGAETPLLLNLLLERLLGRRVLDEIASVDRGPRASFVAPQRPAQPDANATASEAGTRETRTLRDESRPVLLVALLALLWEIAALARQGWRLRASPQAEAS